MFLFKKGYPTYPLQRMKIGAFCTFEKFRTVSLFVLAV